MNPLNVLETYVFAENYGDQHLVYQCLRLIDRHASHILSSSSFPSLPAGLVTNIVARATLSSTEIEVFEALVRWSQAEIQRHLDCDEEVGSIGIMECWNVGILKFLECWNIKFFGILAYQYWNPRWRCRA